MTENLVCFLCAARGMSPPHRRLHHTITVLGQQGRRCRRQPVNLTPTLQKSLTDADVPGGTHAAECRKLYRISLQIPQHRRGLLAERREGADETEREGERKCRKRGDERRSR